jgi:hypothetical protein
MVLRARETLPLLRQQALVSCDREAGSIKEKLHSLSYGVRGMKGGIGKNKIRESLNLLLEP